MVNIGRRGEAWEGGEGGWGKSLGMGRGGLNAGVGRGRARKVGVHGSLGCSQRWGRREEGAVGVGMGWILSRVVGNGDWMSREGVWWARERLRVMLMDFYVGPSYLNPFPTPGHVVGPVHGRRGRRAAARGAPGAAR